MFELIRICFVWNDGAEDIEIMAQSLYREWFVKFPFLGYQYCEFKESGLRFYSSNDVPFLKTPDMHSGMFVLETAENLSPKG